MKALVTGITGQDGYYLTEFLLSRGYEIHGLIRSSRREFSQPFSALADRIILHRGDLLDQTTMFNLIEDINPDEIYNLAAYHPPDDGWDQPWLTNAVNVQAVVSILESIRRFNPKIGFFQASSSAMFGSPHDFPQTEKTALQPRTPYAVSKAMAQLTVDNYRRHYGLRACTGILYNHESPHRNPDFLTRRITRAAAMIKEGRQQSLTLNSVDFEADWGFAGDYVRAFWMMLQHPQADDYIIATGKSHTLEDFCRAAFESVNLNWHEYVRFESNSLPASKTVPLIGNTSYARHQLLWEPEVSFEAMIRDMVRADLTEPMQEDNDQPPATASHNRIKKLNIPGVSL